MKTIEAPQLGYIKVCGITSVDDARLAADAGASAIGINLWPKSPRYVSLQEACGIADAVRDRLEIVAVTVNMDLAALKQVANELSPHRLQLHGEEPDEILKSLGAVAFKAVGVADAADADRAEALPGVLVLVDAKDETRRGGTGKSPDLSLAARVCAARPTLIAGGLHPDNVVEVIQACRPVGVDAASGLEVSAGHKNPEKVQQFVSRATKAFEGLRMHV